MLGCFQVIARALNRFYVNESGHSAHTNKYTPPLQHTPSTCSYNRNRSWIVVGATHKKNHENFFLLQFISPYDFDMLSSVRLPLSHFLFFCSFQFFFSFCHFQMYPISHFDGNNERWLFVFVEGNRGLSTIYTNTYLIHSFLSCGINAFGKLVSFKVISKMNDFTLVKLTFNIE